ncbi:MAG TPA: competence/damage-inducible protein A [Anaeromyxobacteraceae bacterium]
MSHLVEILSTGDELLTGQIVDTNSAWLMDRLWDLGVMVRRKTLVADDRADLLAALTETTARADLVVMSGGLGPTEDDLTAECVAAALGVPLEEDAASLAAIRARFEKLGRTMTPNNAKQARFPRGAVILPNRFGTAPGFRVKLQRAELVCLPGVPAEYRGLCEEAVLPRVAASEREVPAARLVKLIGIPESHADQAMRPVMDAPENAGVRFGYRAHWPEIHVKWSVPGPGAEARAERILAAVRRLFGDAIFAEGKQDLPQLVVERLVARAERLAIAESCTGGLVAEMVTSVPGASATFDVGVVAYANEAKTGVLGVDAAVLAAHGAVSEPVARAMAEGARRRAGTTWALAVTGVAGPGGGTEEKPVGTVHLAIAGPDGTRTWARRFPGDRDRIRKTAAYDVLNQLRLLIR